MTLDDLKTLTEQQKEVLKKSAWAITDLATAQVKDLTKLKGIGRVTAERVIEEARSLLNEEGAKEAARLAKERYYMKAPPAKIVADWTEGGLPIKEIALTSARALAVLKGIKEDLALRCISYAQDELNRMKLYESRTMAPQVRESSAGSSSAAFPEEWLSGATQPPPMSVRVKANFERAKKAYEAANG